MSRIKTNFLFLLLIWVGVTFWAILQYDKSLFSLTRSHPLQSIHYFSEEKLLKGGEISGSFTAAYDNLGTVSINFALTPRVAYRNEDKLVFRLREKDAEDWYFESPYKSGLMHDVPFFPFGFPVIDNSAGKTYEFELISFRGDEKNALSLKRGYPTFESRYILPRSSVLESPFSVIDFVTKKFINKISTLEIVFISAIASLPLVVYVLWYLSFYKIFKNSIKKRKKIQKFVLKILSWYQGEYTIIQESYYFILATSLLIAVVLDVTFIHIRTNITYLVILLMWLRSFKNNKYADLISGILALILLCLTPIFLYTDQYVSSLKSSAWSLVYFFASLVFVVLKRKFTKDTTK